MVSYYVLELSATVNGIDIHMGADNLVKILGVPYVGFSDYKSQTWPFVYGVDNTTISHTVSDHPLPQAQIFPASFLSAKNKLLKSLITNTSLPRIENRGECLIMDQVLLWLLSHATPIILPHLMLLHMQHVSASSHYYSYGLWLTRVFRAFDVLLPTSKGVLAETLSDDMLSRMELCVLGGELLKRDFQGFQPKEACVGCLKMQEEVGQVKKQIQQLLAWDRARDRLVV